MPNLDKKRIREALSWASSQNISDASSFKEHARAVLEHYMEKESGYALFNDTDVLAPDIWEKFQNAVQQLSAGVPLSRILNRREFWSLPFQLSPDTLDPRPDSETLVDVVLARVRHHPVPQPKTILDMGTGSGCLLLSILHTCPGLLGVGSDINEGALATARENARTLNLDNRATFIRSDWGSALTGPFDMIISNPPYIKTSDILDLDSIVQDYDPRLALDGGESGLACYEILIPQARALLSPNGFFACEIGYDQQASVSDLLLKNGGKNIVCTTDYGGNPRVISCSFSE